MLKETHKLYQTYKVARQIIGLPMLENLEEKTLDQLNTLRTQRTNHARILGAAFVGEALISPGIQPLLDLFGTNPQLMPLIFVAMARTGLEMWQNISQGNTIQSEIDKRVSLRRRKKPYL